MSQLILCLNCNTANKLTSGEWLSAIGAVLAGITISVLESRLGFPIEPWLGVGRIWLQDTVRVAYRFLHKLV